MNKNLKDRTSIILLAIRSILLEEASQDPLLIVTRKMNKHRGRSSLISSRGGKWAIVCVRDDTRATVIYTADGRARKRRCLGHARKRGKRRNGCDRETVRGMMEEWKRCNPDGTRIRMTHRIICVYVIREIRHGGGTVTLYQLYFAREPAELLHWFSVSEDHGITLHLWFFEIRFLRSVGSWSIVHGINISVYVTILNYALYHHDRKKKKNEKESNLHILLCLILNTRNVEK